MSAINKEIEKHIKKLILPLEEDDILIPILKKRLTKKEYKLLCMMAADSDISEQYSKLNLDRDSYEKLKIKLVKKLNQEKLKQEMMI
ncbi:hypothetical protein MNB_SV-6-1875 [hydrothermal vent metagenome]|uniref:Uncharacterized protein n=1 Tax=hydrothermal vent metagenome TaxID=652676 RepID=A0A1W1C4M4_9ZZZZ